MSKTKRIIVNLCITLFFLSNLAGQSKFSLVFEPTTGVTWRKTIYGSSGLFVSRFNPSNYTGLLIGVEKNRWCMGIEKRGQMIDFKATRYYFDTSISFYKSFIFINSIKLEYNLVKKKRLISSILFAYSLSARTYNNPQRVVKIDKFGNSTKEELFWYQRSGAYFGGIKVSIRNPKDNFKLGIHAGAERLRGNKVSFGEWYNWWEHNMWYYMVGMNFAYKLDFKCKKK